MSRVFLTTGMIAVLMLVQCSGMWADFPLGDLSGDCAIDLDDLGIFAAEWLAGPASPANLNDASVNDVGVDWADFSILRSGWMLQGIEPFYDSFTGPTLEDGWTPKGAGGSFVDGGYRISHNGSGQDGLSRVVGEGDFVAVLDLDNMSFTGIVDNQWKFIDSSGYQFLVQLIHLDPGLQLNAGVWTGSAYLHQQNAVLNANTTDLTIRMTWQDDPAVGAGGTWQVEYEVDGGGYQEFVTVSSGVYLSDDGPARFTEFWSAAGGNAVIDVDRFEITCPGAVRPDTDITPPTPDPMRWATPPSAISNTITMTAATATDDSGVQYFFQCTAGGGNDSGWQDSPYYEDPDLLADTEYTYRVKARDKSGNRNETAYSDPASATTGQATAEFSLLEAQVGYHSTDVKKAFLRSSLDNASLDGTAFEVVDADSGQVVYDGLVEYWGYKWLTWWCVCDFSALRQAGSYYLRVVSKQSSVFEISDMVFTEAQLAMVALDQLDDRLVTWSDTQGHTVTIYHGCAARVTAELQAVGNVVHALADIYDNKDIYDNLSPAYQQKLIDHLLLGADYMVASQLYSIDPVMFSDVQTRGTHIHSWVSIVYYDVPMYAYEGQVFNGWQDMGVAMTALARAVQTLTDLGGHPTKIADYMHSIEISYETALARPWYLPAKQAIMTEQTDPGLDVGTYFLEIYDRSEPKGWLPSTELRVRDMLPFVWACTMLHDLTGQQGYIDTAAEYADRIAALQFVDWENPIEGTFGTFYAFPNDTTSMMLEHHQFHAWNLGATTPTNMAGMITLIDKAADHPNVADWYNAVKTYGENYVKASGQLSPFGIYPFSTYTDPVHGGVKFFQVYAHGSMGGHYGAMGRFLMTLGDFLNDSSYQELANNNVNFVVGLNSGFPTAYEETEWYATSLIKGVGVNYFDRPTMGGAGGKVQPVAQFGSGFNGFSAFPQFAPGFLADAPDGPRGIITPSGGYYFNEDWLVHSHAYVSGVATLEGPFQLNVTTTYDGAPVIADVQLDLTENAAPYAALLFDYDTDGAGVLQVNDLPLQTAGTISVTYSGTTISRHVETIGSGSFTWDLDFANYVDAVIDAPDLLQDAAGTVAITLTNHGSENVTADVFLSASGVSLSSSQLTVPLLAGQTLTEYVSVTAGQKVMPYLIYARTTAGSNVTTATGSAKVGSSF